MVRVMDGVTVRVRVRVRGVVGLLGEDLGLGRGVGDMGLGSGYGEGCRVVALVGIGNRSRHDASRLRNDRLQLGLRSFSERTTFSFLWLFSGHNSPPSLDSTRIIRRKPPAFTPPWNLTPSTPPP